MPEEIILELSWVLFHGFLSKMKSNLYEYFTNDAMQNNASHTLRLLVQSQKFQEIKPKTHFPAHSKRFFVHTLLHLSATSIPPPPPSIKCTMKIQNRGKFHKYSICGCQVKNFPSFGNPFSTHEMALLGVFLGLLSTKDGPILMKFSPEIVY